MDAGQDFNPPAEVKRQTRAPTEAKPTVGVKPLTGGQFKPLEVVISGAGPAGLLLAHYLLEKGGGRFRVSLFDWRDDPRRARDSTDPGIRRYSIGLGMRGAAAIAPIPGLWGALQAAGTPVTAFTFTMFGRSFTLRMPPEWNPPLAIDRMELCAGLLEELLGRHAPGGSSDLLSVTFDARCTGADLRGHVATFEDASGAKSETRQVPYDLLVGADGVRSRVRLAMMEQTWGFDVEQRTIDIATVITYIQAPEGIIPGTILRIPALPKCKNLGVFLFPGTKDRLCLTMGWSDTCPPEEWLSIKDAKEAKAFLDSQIPWMKDVSEEAVEDLRAQTPFLTTVVKCSRYHDAAAAVALLGDAAHATPPFIGQGCNVALEDAATLAHLLLRAAGVNADDETALRLAKLEPLKDLDAPATTREQARARLPAALEVYSALRVPEGHALVDLSESRAAFSTSARVRMAVREIWKNFLLFASRGFFRGPVRSQAGGTTDPLAEILERNKGEVRSVLDSNKRIREEWLKKQREKKMKAGLAVLVDQEA
ncbi:hypothetical protein KFL_002780020 [Klebsormidium nitens]|uniref:FAD-binding domain-containing protein n=1 Tax=Klebsormidium nitens TaxID=105231 RepID=A0A1Y1IDS8_KLENI|nr:hypothetical protein KFL_002780020 [Klebsormidium nitens]|eukprot:GAQ86238.1 hypothetical protein KFL_002780020 [Klebsormidium nitens]